MKTAFKLTALLTISLFLIHLTSCGGGGTTSTSSQPVSGSTKQLGTAADDYGNGVTVDADGNVYVSGYTAGGLDGNTSAGDYDIFLVKYDGTGTKQWTIQLGTSSIDVGTGVATNAAGNIYVGGYTAGDLDGNGNAGGYDLFLVKYDASGTRQWTRQLGTSAYDWCLGLAVDSSANIYLTGYTAGDLDGNTNAGGSDMILVKYDEAGTKQWTRQLGTSSSDVSNGVAADAGGNIYVAGTTAGDLDGNTGAGEYDVFLVKYNSEGTKQWTRQLGTTSFDYASGIAVDTSGNIYICGSTFGDLDGNTSAGSYDMFLVKYDAAGDRQWTRQMGTSTSDWGISVATDTGGNVYVAGHTNGGMDGNTSAGGSDIFLVKYNSAGLKQWTRQSGTSASDWATGVYIDAGGNLYVTGYTSGGLDGNTNAGGYDIFLMKYNTDGDKQ